MQLLPVLDLKNGKVVRAVRGRRASYRPLETAFHVPPTPGAVAELCVSRFGLTRVYVADLDALAGGAVACDALADIAQRGAKIVLDAGTATRRRANELVGWDTRHGCLDGIVVALESTRDDRDWPDLVGAVTVRRAVFSLDLRAGNPLTQCARLAGLDPIEIARRAYAAGFRRLIVLDLAAVGTDRGPVTLALCRELRGRHRWREVITGGAVRHAGDLAAIEQAGGDAALVASALYDGRLAAAVHGSEDTEPQMNADKRG